MLTVTENTTQQINAALFEQDQNVKNKLSTVSGVVSAVYGACEWIFNKLKESLARVATTGSYNDLTDKPTIVDTVAQNVPNAVSSNAVYGALTNYATKDSIKLNGLTTVANQSIPINNKGETAKLIIVRNSTLLSLGALAEYNGTYDILWVKNECNVIVSNNAMTIPVIYTRYTIYS